jgi:hypothetical protein
MSTVAKQQPQQLRHAGHPSQLCLLCGDMVVTSVNTPWGEPLAIKIRLADGASILAVCRYAGNFRTSQQTTSARPQVPAHPKTTFDLRFSCENVRTRPDVDVRRAGHAAMAPKPSMSRDFPQSLANNPS